MTTSALRRPVPRGPEQASRRRWNEFLEAIAGLLPAGPASVFVDGDNPQADILASRLASTLNAAGRRCFRLPAGGLPADIGTPCIPDTVITLAVGPRWRATRRWDVVIGVRTRHCATGPGGEAVADIDVDLCDPQWPVIRQVAAPLADHGPWYLTETRAFFAARAATWDTKLGKDLFAYADAITQARIPDGSLILDAGCGTGPALGALRQAVGPRGHVIAIDLTPEMLAHARPRAAAAAAALILADARVLPLAAGSVDAIFAAGLIMHLPDPVAGLRELARITRAGGQLIIFHPSGRAALAARHGRTLSPDDPLAREPLGRATRTTGWQLTTYDDAEHRFFAVATRQQDLNRHQNDGDRCLAVDVSSVRAEGRPVGWSRTTTVLPQRR